jgi:hypothetical protein
MTTFIVIAIPCFALALLLTAVLMFLTDIQYLLKEDEEP